MQVAPFRPGQCAKVEKSSAMSRYILVKYLFT